MFIIINHLMFNVYRSSLRKLIHKLRFLFIIKTFVKKLKCLVAFLRHQKIGSQLGSPPPPLFSQNRPIKTK